MITPRGILYAVFFLVFCYLGWSSAHDILSGEPDITLEAFVILLSAIGIGVLAFRGIRHFLAKRSESK